MYRVYDDRTDETLFRGRESIDCVGYINSNFNDSDDDFEHIWIEKIGWGDYERQGMTRPIKLLD